MTNPSTDHDGHHRAVIRAVPHAGELDARGIPIACPNCRAHHDWLLLNVRHLVFVRCRCAYEFRVRSPCCYGSCC